MKTIFAILCSTIVYILPYMGVARVMIPVFWIGYIMMMYYEQYRKYHRIIGAIALVLFIGLFYFWNGDTMHYSASASVTLYHVLLGKHGYTMMNLAILAYRIILGVAGCIAIISICHELKSVNKYISIIGASTAGIYILQTFLLEEGMRCLFERYVDLSSWSLCRNYLLMIGISVVSTCVITWLYQQLRRCSWVDLLLFGCGKLAKMKI